MKFANKAELAKYIKSLEAFKGDTVAGTGKKKALYDARKAEGCLDGYEKAIKDLPKLSK